jgi:hypothetical protein
MNQPVIIACIAPTAAVAGWFVPTLLDVRIFEWRYWAFALPIALAVGAALGSLAGYLLRR